MADCFLQQLAAFATPGLPLRHFHQNALLLEPHRERGTTPPLFQVGWQKLQPNPGFILWCLFGETAFLRDNERGGLVGAAGFGAEGGAGFVAVGVALKVDGFGVYGLHNLIVSSR